MDLLEARHILHKHGYELIDEAYNYLYEADEEDDFESSDETQETVEKQQADGDMSVQLKHIVDRLRGIDNYEQYVSALKGMKPIQVQLLQDLIGNGEFAKEVKVQKGIVSKIAPSNTARN